MMLVQMIPDLIMGGPGAEPPGADKLLKIVDWVRWIAFTVCILGILIAGAMMAVGQRRGEGGEHAARLGWVMAACVVIASSTLLVEALK